MKCKRQVVENRSKIELFLIKCQSGSPEQIHPHRVRDIACHFQAGNRNVVPDHQQWHEIDLKQQ
jgi:hypothetical protein